VRSTFASRDLPGSRGVLSVLVDGQHLPTLRAHLTPVKWCVPECQTHQLIGKRRPHVDDLPDRAVTGHFRQLRHRRATRERALTLTKGNRTLLRHRPAIGSDRQRRCGFPGLSGSSSATKIGRPDVVARLRGGGGDPNRCAGSAVASGAPREDQLCVLWDSSSVRLDPGLVAAEGDADALGVLSRFGAWSLIRGEPAAVSYDVCRKQGSRARRRF
jgi:hypothetical protein